jgi:cell division protein FtsL
MADYKTSWLKIKSAFKKGLAKTGIIPENRFALRRNTLISYVVITAIATAIIFYMVGSYFKEIEVGQNISSLSVQIAEKEAELSNVTTSLEEARNLSAQQQDQLNSTNLQLQSCQGSLQDLQGNVTSLQVLSSTVQSQLTDCQTNMTVYQTVVQNSVRAVCCSFGDVLAGTVKNWQIFSNSIICSGNSTVDCATGATS